jgi:ribose transport system ATP-binding protein
LNEEKKPILQIVDVVKSFPGVKALSNVSMEVMPGEVHALVGENGAGKSTLIKIITGFHAMDSGRMLVDGKEVNYKNPHESIENGISCIYQELSIVPLIDVAKNLYLGNWPKKAAAWWTARRCMREPVRSCSVSIWMWIRKPWRATCRSRSSRWSRSAVH